MPRELGNVMSFVQQILNQLLRVELVVVVYYLALNLGEEAAELVRCHVGPTFGVFVEEFSDFVGRFCLPWLELPPEADADSVATHAMQLIKIKLN